MAVSVFTKFDPRAFLENEVRRAGLLKLLNLLTREKAKRSGTQL